MNPEEILEKGDAIKVAKINYLYYIHKDYETIEKVIKLCFGKIDPDNDLKFLTSAITNDVSFVFEILDKLNYDYERKTYIEYATLYKSKKCIEYFGK
jgi:hypothetical protein